MSSIDLSDVADHITHPITAGVWEKVFEIVLDTPQQSITVSGLDGDTDRIYLILAHIKNGAGSVSWYYIKPNSIGTGFLHSYHYVVNDNGALSHGYGFQGTYNLGFHMWGLGGYEQVFVKGFIYAKTGLLRKSQFELSRKCGGNKLEAGLISTWWDETVSNITSLLFDSSQPNAYDVGTHIIVLAFRG